MDSYRLLLLVRQTASFSSDDIARASCPISHWMMSQRHWDDYPPTSLQGILWVYRSRVLLLVRQQAASSSSDDIARASCSISRWMKSQRCWDDYPSTSLQGMLWVYRSRLLLLVRQTASSSSDDIARASGPISHWMKSQRRWDDCPPVSGVQLNWRGNHSQWTGGFFASAVLILASFGGFFSCFLAISTFDPFYGRSNFVRSNFDP